MNAIASARAGQFPRLDPRVQFPGCKGSPVYAQAESDETMAGYILTARNKLKWLNPSHQVRLNSFELAADAFALRLVQREELALEDVLAKIPRAGRQAGELPQTCQAGSDQGYRSRRIQRASQTLGAIPSMDALHSLRSADTSGKWWVVRWWMDMEGQDKRVHKRARICPISGPGVLSKSERLRRAREIVTESGADTVEHFNAVVVKKQETVTTFQEQGARWLGSLQTRKRKPVALSTIEDWERILNKWLNPHIGSFAALRSQQRFTEAAGCGYVWSRVVSEDDR